MNFVYSILNHMKNNSEFNKKLVIVISFLLCLLDVHLITDEDIANNSSFAAKIASITDPAHRLK
jgi:hypothetical protein